MTAAVLIVTCSLVAQGAGQNTDRYGMPSSAPSTTSDRGGLIYNPSAPVAESSGFSEQRSQTDRSASQAPLPTTSAANNQVNDPFGGGSGNSRATQSSRGPESLRSGQQPSYRSATAGTQRPQSTLPIRSSNNNLTGTSTTGTSTTGNGGYKPAWLMGQMLAAPPASRLSGTRTSLAQVVHGAESRRAQSDRINAYWDLCSSAADYYLGLRELDEFNFCGAKISKNDPVWRQAEVALNTRINTSRQAAVAAQYRLAGLMGRGESGPMPLPSDLPHCGDYHTRYSEIFRGRGSAEAALLGDLLPLRYRELNDAADRVKSAEDFLNLVARNAGPDAATGVVNALSVLALQRRAFVQITKDYNRQIVRYSELATPGHLESQRLVAMLIKTTNRTNTATRPAARPPTTDPYGRQSSTQGTGATATFADDSRWARRGNEDTTAATHVDEAVTPASAENAQAFFDQERSVLVPSQSPPPPSQLENPW